MKQFINYFTKSHIISIIVSFLLGITICLIVSHKNTDLIVAEAIVEFPEIFPLNKGLHTYCEKWLNIYYTMDETNFNDEELLGFTLSEAKTAALSKILTVMTDSMAVYYKQSKANNFGAFRIGDLKHNITGNYMAKANWTKEQNALYLTNLQKILQAIPNNLPNMQTLSKFKIVEVHYFDDFAQVKFEEDRLSEALTLKGKQYRGQF